MTFKLSADDRQGTIEWEVNFLDDPIPSGACVDSATLPKGRGRDHYPTALQVREDDQLNKVGLRCVIPLGQSRERP
jgi:hypothetical protein